ncbi:uncharacterized protein JN550_013261 [Neoarthrinium moseri]|uniref:uncharacterized protein n=1 Tax=Neoarthrinium moseri TaxID=1658444 RepID=UPI001FDDF993|nr:uncharacterized protein JN550_013261 [Neoarthrinium moseri]KAI1857381.1 hypothetical protein JN550_013261 [Neoarthrinium moseri]
MSFKTPYGLIVDRKLEGTISVRLAYSVPNAAATANIDAQRTQQPQRSNNPNCAAYHYYIWPDYQTSFVWYDAGWSGNPEGEDDVEENKLKSQYSATWCDARQAWVYRYTAAFEAQECDLGSGKEPFTDAGQGRSRLVEGMLLACWLAL